MPSRLCIKFLHLNDPKGEKVSNVLLYVKRLKELPITSGKSMFLEETKSNTAEVLNFRDDFVLSTEDEYIQIMFIKTDNKVEYLVDEIFCFNTLFQMLCQSNPSKRQYVETIHTAVLEKNYSITFFLQLLNNVNNETKQKRNEDKLYRTRGHVLSLETFTRLTYCAFCSKLLLGLFEQGYKCTQCRLVAHGKCCERIPFWCEFAFVEPPRLMTGNGLKRGEIPHCFEPMKRAFSRILHFCDHCGSSAWNNVLKCRNCNLVVHEKCLGFIPPLCGTKPKVLANQIANGIIKEIFPSPNTSDGENRYSSTSTSSTMSSGDVAWFSSTISIQSEVIPKWTDFECVGRLGQGASSKVYVAKHTPTNEYVTLKVVNGTNSEAREQLKQEKQILFDFGFDNPYIIKAYCTFHHGNYLFLVMECAGGDTLDKKIMKKPHNENDIRYYMIEIISVLQYLHSKQIVYRDLKPEHIVVNAEGHIRLIDFGLTKIKNNNEDACNTICGTLGYIAPEVQQLEMTSSDNDDYSYTVDYWALGIIFAQLLRNQPFIEIYEYTTNLADVLLDGCSTTAEARSLLSGLLELDKDKRLGSPTSPHGQIREHPFFQYKDGIDWAKVDEGGYKSVNSQIRSMDSGSGSFHNTPLSRITFDRDIKADCDEISRSKCTDSNEREYKTFDAINYKIRSVFSPK